MKNFKGLLWLLAGTGLAIVLTAVVYPALIESLRWVRPIGTVRLSEWLKLFRTLGWVGLGVCTFWSLVWWVVGEWLAKKPSSFLTALYFFFLFTALIACLVPAYWLPNAERQWLAYLFYGLNALVAYYLPTLLGSSPTLSLIPPGGKYLP